ncbi:MAG TPA: photosynthetic reaction center cytochrome c subunit family protein [Vicinamibacterales bacterium]|nr:photosynthetic reaction center cytochrome c subunit family protein [Vicinamibacterales bacterium]
MTRTWWRINLAIAVIVVAWASGLIAAAQGQTPAPAAGKKAGEAFKNVTTSTLKELSVDDFIASMGLISANLGLDCADCHPNAGTDKADFVIDTPRKITTRRMVEMVAGINRTNFGGVQRVTCWTCHHGRITPSTTISLDAWYDAPNVELDDAVRQEDGQPTADQVLDKYIAALGGAQKLAAVTSFVASGTAIGYGELGGNADFTLMAKSPNQRAILISYKDTQRPSSSWSFDGRNGWIKTPRGLLGDYELIGGELDGARLEAQLSFPGQIKQALTNWRGAATRSIGDRDFVAVQGSGPRGFLATLYFDPKTNLLARVVRYGPSPIGRMPTQIDYADYRDVGGVKFPFEYKFLWLDGRYTAKLSKVEPNVAIDAAKFGRPTVK